MVGKKPRTGTELALEPALWKNALRFLNHSPVEVLHVVMDRYPADGPL